MATTAAPAFNLTYDVRAPSNFGESYAAGIGAAGKSIADALGNVTSIMSQSAEVNDQIDMFSKMKDSQGNALMSQEDKDALMGKGLGARQAFVGEIMGRWGAQYKSQLAAQTEAEKQKLTQPYELEKLQKQYDAAAANQAAADARAAAQRRAEIAQQAEEARKTQQQEYELRNAPIVLVPPKPPATGATEAEKQAELQRRKNKPLSPDVYIPSR